MRTAPLARSAMDRFARRISARERLVLATLSAPRRSPAKAPRTVRPASELLVRLHPDRFARDLRFDEDLEELLVDLPVVRFLLDDVERELVRHGLLVRTIRCGERV